MDTKLLAKYIFLESTSEEKKQVEKWLAASEKNQDELNRLKQRISLATRRYRPDTFQAKRAFRKIEQQAGTKRIRTRSVPYRYVAAAIVTLLLGSGILYFMGNQKIKILTVQCHSGEILELRLPDSTLLTLSGPSEISYPARFAEDKREVSMSGQVYFQVHRDTLQPFIVNTSSIKVTVLGTAFQVTANEQKAEVLVSSGKVAVDLPDHSSREILTAGMMTQWTRQQDRLTTGHEFDANKLSWKTKILKFNNTPLSEVIQILNKHYKVNLVLPEKYKDLRLTATFESLSLAETLDIINQTLDIQLSIPGK